MLLIRKKSTPNLLKNYIQSDDINKSFQNMPSDIKTDLKKHLLDEQGFLCAYCMKKIDDNVMKIEHFLPQSKYPNKSLEYNNLFACCDGGISNRENDNALSCDTKKENRETSINPLKNDIEEKITYTPEGEIISDNDNYTHDMNEILNLNSSRLKRNRNEVCQLIIKEILNNQNNKTYLMKLLNYWKENRQGVGLPEYAGVAKYFLKLSLSKSKVK